jgi:hypothetical protein
MKRVSNADAKRTWPGKMLVNESEGLRVLELRGERSATTASSAGVGIAEFEAPAVKAGYVVDGCTLEMRYTVGIYVDLEVA